MTLLTPAAPRIPPVTAHPSLLPPARDCHVLISRPHGAGGSAVRDLQPQKPAKILASKENSDPASVLPAIKLEKQMELSIK